VNPTAKRPSITISAGWGKKAPAGVLAALKRVTPMPIGVRGSTLSAELGYLSDLPLAARQQLVGTERLSLTRTSRFWIFVESNAPIVPYGCPSIVIYGCKASVKGTWVAVVDPENDRVLLDMNY